MSCRYIVSGISAVWKHKRHHLVPLVVVRLKGCQETVKQRKSKEEAKAEEEQEKNHLGRWL